MKLLMALWSSELNILHYSLICACGEHWRHLGELELRIVPQEEAVALPHLRGLRQAAAQGQAVELGAAAGAGVVGHEAVALQVDRAVVAAHRGSKATGHGDHQGGGEAATHAELLGDGSSQCRISPTSHES